MTGGRGVTYSAARVRWYSQSPSAPGLPLPLLPPPNSSHQEPTQTLHLSLRQAPCLEKALSLCFCVAGKAPGPSTLSPTAPEEGRPRLGTLTGACVEGLGFAQSFSAPRPAG